MTASRVLPLAGHPTPEDDLRVARPKSEKTPEKVAAGLRVKQRRTELGLTQQQLAHEIGLSTISKHEQGVQGFSAETLTALAQVLGVTERWILYGEDEATNEVVEDDWQDHAAWIELEQSGVIDEMRRKGLPEENIQRIRRWEWRGTPVPRDYERLLEAALLGPTLEPAEELEAARDRRRAAGKRAVPLRPRR